MTIITRGLGRIQQIILRGFGRIVEPSPPSHRPTFIPILPTKRKFERHTLELQAVCALREHSEAIVRSQVIAKCEAFALARVKASVVAVSRALIFAFRLAECRLQWKRSVECEARARVAFVRLVVMQAMHSFECLLELIDDDE